jgi:hypothetical protein
MCAGEPLKFDVCSPCKPAGCIFICTDVKVPKSECVERVLVFVIERAALDCISRSLNVSFCHCASIHASSSLLVAAAPPCRIVSAISSCLERNLKIFLQ